MAKKSAKIRILIADDHAVFRYGLRTLLDSEPMFKVVGEAVDGSEVAKLMSELKPAVLMLDLAMPRLTGIEVLRDLASAEDAACVIILTAAIEKRQIVEALQLGARGILLKDAAVPLVTKCIQTVLTGDYWVDHEAVSSLVDYLKRFVSGRSNKEIAAKLSISEDTVKHHLSNIFDKAGVSNRLELAIWSMNKGFV
jgi:two-component system nitrate/nitrite response regulator NarL